MNSISHHLTETAKEVKVVLNLLGKHNAEMMRPWLKRAGTWMAAAADDAFEEQGPNWAKLRRSTVSDRVRRGFQGQGPILVRSGSLRNSGKIEVDDKKGEVTFSFSKTVKGSQEYDLATIHHYGTRDGRIPSRKIFQAKRLENLAEALFPPTFYENLAVGIDRSLEARLKRNKELVETIKAGRRGYNRE